MSNVTFQVSLDGDRRPVVQARVGAEAGRDTAPKKKFKATCGSVVVWVYPAKKGGWSIPWYDTFGVRRLAQRMTRADAKAFADGKAEELSLVTSRLQRFKDGMSEADMEEYIRLQEYCVGHNITVGQLLEFDRQRMEKISRAKIVDKPCPQIVTELLETLRAQEAGARWIDNLDSRLTRFGKHFTVPIGEVADDDVLRWLRGLRDERNGKLLGKRSFNNYRTVLVKLIAFAKEREYLAPDAKLLKTVKPWELEKGEEEIYTPKEMRAMLFAADKHYPNHLAVFASMGLSGCRHCEFCEETSPEATVLDWSNYHFDTGLIHVTVSVAKSNTGRRYVPMPASLVSWLQPYRKVKGPVCEVANLTNALRRIAAKAGVKYKRNALRNSFISYRAAVTHDLAKVSREAGNSVQEIADSYLKELTEAQGHAWFNIAPPWSKMKGDPKQKILNFYEFAGETEAAGET